MLSAQGNLQGVSIQKRLGQKLLELSILCFKVSQPLGVRYCHPTKFSAPSVKRRIAKTMLPTQFPDRYAPICLFQKPNNLFVSKSLLHVRPPPEKRTLLDFSWHFLLGAHQFWFLHRSSTPSVLALK